MKHMPRPPKKISPFDVALGNVVRSKRVKKKLSQAAIADATGIAMSNYQRREDGRNEITVSELERIAAAMEVPALAIVEEALDDYGGLQKLLKEHRGDDPMSDGTSNITPIKPLSPEDNVRYLGAVDAPADAAADDDPRTPHKD